MVYQLNENNLDLDWTFPGKLNSTWWQDHLQAVLINELLFIKMLCKLYTLWKYHKSTFLNSTFSLFKSTWNAKTFNAHFPAKESYS